MSDPGTLRVGDRIRIVGMPGEGVPNYTFHEDTRNLFDRLIARRVVLRIRRVDEWGVPWVEYRHRDEEGRWVRHKLAITEFDRWMRLEPR